MSNPKTILFRADSSSNIGTGHIMRDLVLAQQYTDAKIIFATQALEGNINHKILEAGYKLKTLESNDFKEFNALVQKQTPDLIVIDHYSIDVAFEKKLKKNNPKSKLLVLDDTYEKHYCDILLNHNLSADTNRYKDLVPSWCKLRCGSKYTLLRDEFREPFPQKKTSNTKRVFIAMGGVDSRELNIPILKTLESFDDIEVTVVTSSANKNLAKLQEYVQNKKHITLYINTNSIAQLMHESDFAIITPSVTVNEVHFMKLPFIAIKTEANQKDIYEYLQEHNFLTIENFTLQALQKLITLQLKILNATLTNFIQLTKDEKEIVLNWRNDNSIRKWMLNKENITCTEHYNYIESLKTKKDRIYFLVKEEHIPVGVVDLTNIQHNNATLGIYAKPNTSGIGKILMYMIINYAFNSLNLKKLYAKVYINNTRALQLYQNFHFKEIARDKNIIQMELINENS